jgi:hypothetical protein
MAGRNVRQIEFRQPPVTVKAITYAGQILFEWMAADGVLHETEFPPEMLPEESTAPTCE